MKLSFVGLGKLGLPFSLCLAEAGFDVIGIDINENVLKKLRMRKAPIIESRVQELLDKHYGKNFWVTNEHKKAIYETDVTFVLTATPSDDDGSFSNKYLIDAMSALATHFSDSKKQRYHLFIISCTVEPETLDNVIIPLIEKISKKKINFDFGIVYDPDFVALGSVIKDFQNPDIVIIGESNPKAGKIVEDIHKKMCKNEPVITRMTLVNAEIAKVCLNVYITAKITFANLVSNLCEEVPGGDSYFITKGIGNDRRISPFYFSGGLAFGGPCFPRDVRAFKNILRKYDTEMSFIESIEKINNFQNEHLKNTVIKHLGNGKRVGILGVSFKEGTDFLGDSPSIALITGFLKERNDIVIYAYDKYAGNKVKELFGTKLIVETYIEEVLKKCNLIVLAYRSKEFSRALYSFKPNREITVIDCWRILDAGKLNNQIKYIPFGRFM